MANEDLTPEEIEQIKREHLELLKRKDSEARKKVQGLKSELPASDTDELSEISEDNLELENLDENESKNDLIKKSIEKDRRVQKKKVRKKHTRGVKSFTRDYLSIVFIIIAMIVLIYYAYMLTL